MSKLNEMNSKYPSIDSTNVLQNDEMNKLLGGGDCKSCGESCKSSCSQSSRDGLTKAVDPSGLVAQPLLNELSTVV